MVVEDAARQALLGLLQQLKFGMHPIWIQVGIDLPKNIDVSVPGDLGNLVNDKSGFKETACPFAAQVVPA